MPEKRTVQRAKQAKREGKAPSTQAGEFVREEIHHVREGKHGVRSTKQVIAIGLSKARRAGVKLPPPTRGSAKVKRAAAAETRAGATKRGPVSKARSLAAKRKLRREGHSGASHSALAKHARASAKRRSASDRSASAKKAARTRTRSD